MSLFGQLQVRLDPWQVEYGAELRIESEEEALPDENIILDVEVPPEQWQPITPAAPRIHPRLIFVDGVRRIEARLVVRRADRICHGAFGSYAVGAVTVADGVATYGEPQVGRIVAVGSGESLTEIVPIAAGLEYRPVSIALGDPDGPLRGIQEQMRLAEERLGSVLADAENTLVVADGPLTFEEPLRGGAVGYIKRLFKLYVPSAHIGLLARLDAGQRTPLFALRSSRRFARYSWFLRLAAPMLGDSDLSGVVRLEIAETVGAERACTVANATAQLLPRFAPQRWHDPRSPQNLIPIGALEFQLRRHLGDARLVRRYIETLIAEEARRG